MVKNLPVNARDAGEAGLIPGLEDSLEEEMATHSSILAERIQWMKGPGGPQFKGLQRVRHNRVYTHAQIY